ncbi:MAG: tRNA (adenosine(37)-N6)-threonylcarbamoyltransferase complex transferase subunit TsaD [Myxococcales bacterium FL481]|nr:MAG: tRNA (adenosine(37)-N6)-threonylcarbamoyltransferase complex transferase subunit TsaD [Myxococcales bacterium FL481]
MLVLGIETSCDETACALIRDGRVLSSIIASQIDVHREFGGIVPELASRHHVHAVTPTVTRALEQAGPLRLEDVDAVAVTEAPGLVGALLIGAQFARGLAWAIDRPLVGIHHLEGHICSALLDDNDEYGPTVPAHLALLVSGGHTELVEVRDLGDYRPIGRTRDDAVGEAYDKVAKMLGLSYPGGPVIDALAREGNPRRHAFPRSMLNQDNYAFSFAGLKTAVLVHLERNGAPRSRAELADICASFQQAAVEVLVEKTRRARAAYGFERVHVVGGVAANHGLREAMTAAAETDGFVYSSPPMRYCGDNAAMIAIAAAIRLHRWRDPPPLRVTSTRPLVAGLV